MTWDVIHGDCLDVLRTMDAASVDAIVCDPPYGLSFMGKRWDYDVPSVDVWAECLRVLKPGGHLLSFAGTRTQHRMAVRIEDAGFEIRDMIAWTYGSGFPKSLNIGDGRGTALKPALEPITLARKPLIGTVAENVTQYGTGALNIDGCRVMLPDGRGREQQQQQGEYSGEGATPIVGAGARDKTYGVDLGRWPANLIHDGSPEVLAGFPVSTGQSGAVTGNEPSSATNDIYGKFNGRPAASPRGDSGSAARFFYCAKADRSDREDGCEGLPVVGSAYPGANSFNEDRQRVRADGSIIPPLKARNHHPTVKPTDLMRYLCRLITPPGGTVLDPFTGSGSTGRGAVIEGFSFIGIEREADYCEIARKRIAAAAAQGNLFHEVVA